MIALAPADDQIALVQYRMDSIFDRTVHVFASEGAYLDSYLASIERFNTRPDSATSWNEVVESEGNPLELLLAKQPGNIVLLSGRTATAAQYLFPCTEAGLNTLTSAPLAANTADFNKLRQATELADKQETLIGELTPERYEIASMLQRALARTPEFYGIQLCGSADEPSVRSENVLPLLPIQSKSNAAPSADTYDSWSYPFDTLGMRYAFLLAAAPQIDLIQLALLGRERINYERQIRFISAQRTPIAISKQEYLKATATSSLPAELSSQLTGDTLRLPGNGQLTYILNGVHTALNIRYYLPVASGNALASAKTNSAIEPSTTVSAGIPTTVSLPYRKLTLRGEKAILTLVEEPTNASLRIVQVDLPLLEQLAGQRALAAAGCALHEAMAWGVRVQLTLLPALLPALAVKKLARLPLTFSDPLGQPVRLHAASVLTYADVARFSGGYLVLRRRPIITALAREAAVARHVQLIKQE